MTNLINISFAALLVTNVASRIEYKYDERQRFECMDLVKTKFDSYVITSNYVSHVAIDGKTNTLTLDCVTNHQWTVETKLEWVSKTNGTPPSSDLSRFERWWNAAQTNGIRYNSP